MLGEYIVFGVLFYFLSLFSSSVVALIDRPFFKATWLFVLSNTIGFLSGIMYFIGFFNQKITCAHFDWFLHFAPQITPLSAIFFVIVSGVSAIVGVYSVRYLKLYEGSYDPRIVQFLMSLFVLGMQGVIFANNTFSFVFFWEVMSITSFFLVFSDRSRQSISAAFLYFIMTHLGASAILGGFLILGGGSFFFDLADIRHASQELSPALRNGVFLLFIFGFGSKAGLVPFHIWLPEAHPQAPSNISALMSGLMLKVAIYGFAVVMLAMGDVSAWIGLVVLFLGLLSSVVGVLYAVVERDIKRAFAYSSIENMGVIFAMFGLAIYFFAQNSSVSVIGFSIVAFALFHAISHALFKTALFLSSGVVINRVHTKSLDAMGGIAKMMPIFSFGFLFATLSALPIPPFGTFYGEWGFIQNVINAMRDMIMMPQTIILLLGALTVIGLVSGLAIFAMVRIFSISMLGLSHHDDMEKRDEKNDYLLIVPIIVLGGAVLTCGFFAQKIINALVLTIYNAKNISLEEIYDPVHHMAFTIGWLIILCGMVMFLLKKWTDKNTGKRIYHTWDCGQLINVTMQYSATAFCAPIRFFFLTFIGRKKTMTSQPVIASNPWIVKNTFRLSIRPKWSDILYAPIAKSLLFIADRTRFVQSGRIQYYILALLLALIFTFIFAL
jgi:hydrogenase-4 component B